MFKVIVISKEDLFSGEAEIINQLMGTGDFNFHLRKKTASEKDLRKLLYKIKPEFFSRIVIHQQFNMEKEFGFYGIHLPGAERENYVALKAEGHKIISTSIHVLKEFDPARKNYKYIFFSPLFPSISKAGYAPIYSEEVLRADLKEIKNKSNLIALGGIEEKNLKEVKEFGFAGAAVLGCVWESKTPVKTLQFFLKASAEH
ncbi:MAG: thiamine phosphate synthase [Bacteroidia bacterium]|nr:thiamine phosphate synthase [Bacteroidia bacterium]